MSIIKPVSLPSMPGLRANPEHTVSISGFGALITLPNLKSIDTTYLPYLLFAFAIYICLSWFLILSLPRKRKPIILTGLPPSYERKRRRLGRRRKRCSRSKGHSSSHNNHKNQHTNPSETPSEGNTMPRTPYYI